MSKMLALAGTFAKAGCPFFKVDDEHGIAFGWAIVSTIDGEPYFDTQGDHIPMSAVIKAAERFMKNSRAGDEQHDERRAGDIPFALPVDASIAKSLFNADIEMEGLVIGFKPYDKSLLQKIKDGDRRGFSIGGSLYSSHEVDKSLFGKSIVEGFVKDRKSNVIESFMKGRAELHKTKRIFEDFEIDFISSVDWPAQEPALVTIVKSLDGSDRKEPVLWMRKAVMPPKKPAFGGSAPAAPQKQPQAPGQGSVGAPFQQPQPGQMSQLAAQPVIPTANMMPHNMSPTAAITGPLAHAPNGGSLVPPPSKLTGESDGHQHAIDVNEGSENGVGYTGFGISSVGVSHRHAFVLNPDGSITIAVNDGHTHTPDGNPSVEPEIDEDGNPIEPFEGSPEEEANEPKSEAIAEGDEEDDNALPPYDPMSARRDVPKKPAPTAPSGAGAAPNAAPSGASASDAKPDDSTDGKKKPNPFGASKRASKSVQNSDDGVGLEIKETAMTPEQIAALNKRLELATLYGELNDAQKSFYKSLDKREQAAFLGLTSTQREETIKKAGEADPVVYTTRDGIEIRKSDGKLAHLQAKKLDAQEEELAKARSERDAARFEKRATVEMKHFPKSAAIRGRILKAIEAEFAPKEAGKPTDVEKKAREEALEVIKAADKALSKSYTRMGVGADRGSDEVDDDSPDAAEAKLDKLAKAYAKEHKVPFLKAYDKVVATEEGEALYNKAMGHDDYVGDPDDDDGAYDDLDGQGDDGDGAGSGGGGDDDEEVVIDA